MSTESSMNPLTAPHQEARPARARAAGRWLAGVYARTLLWYLLGVLLLWLLGVESIYGHPTPLYAAYVPVFDSLFVPVAVLGAAGFLTALLMRRTGPSEFPLPSLGAAMGLWGGALVLIIAWDAYRNDASLLSTLSVNLSALVWHLPALLVFTAGAWILLRSTAARDWLTGEPQQGERRKFLFTLWLFLVLFSAAVAALRGGLSGISQAYARETYEYIGDIGKTTSIQALFTRYTEIHEYLSMHAKVHPPGPIVLLWLLSYAASRDALLLGVATILCGAAAIVPLYHWARGLFGEAQARTACLLYVLVPSVVLFTATSTDILFTPFTLATLWLFDRALDRRSARDALLAGLLYGVMSILSFSLLGLGAYFALVGLWRCARREWAPVILTAACMILAFAVFHAALYAWSGFDMIGTFRLAKQQFDLDQHHLDLVTPRLPAWTYRLWNPLTWFFFAGIPVSVLFLWRLRRPAPEVRARIIIFLLTLLALNLLYLARGEGERSALYLFPFLVLPAAHTLNEFMKSQRCISPLLVTCAFLAFQCWLIEAYLYTYW